MKLRLPRDDDLPPSQRMTSIPQICNGESTSKSTARRSALVEWRRHAGPLVLILIFSVAVCSPVLTGNTISMVGAHMYAQYPWRATAPKNPSLRGIGFPHTDHAETFYPASVFATDAYRSGQLPAWLPFSFAGVPVLELGMTGFLYPPRVAGMFLLSPIRQHELIIFAHLLLAGVGMYFLLRVWGAGAAGASFGAIVWELNGHNSFWLVMEHVAIAAAWLPVTLLAATLAARNRSLSWAIAAGVALGLSLLGGGTHYVYLGGVVLFLWYGGQVINGFLRQRKGDLRKALILPALALVSLMVAAIVSAAHWLPLSAWLAEIHRVPFPIEVQLDERSSVGTLLTGMLWPRSASRPEGAPDFASFAFAGLPALLLCPLAFRRLSAPVVLAVGICALSIAVVIGPALLLQLLRWGLPYFATMHLHVFYYLFCFGVAVLACFGLESVVSFLARKRAGSLVAAALVGLVFGVECFQLITFSGLTTPTHPSRSDWLFPETPLIAAAKALPKDRRIIPVREAGKTNKWTPPVLAGKAAAVFQLQSVSGYESLLPNHVGRLWRTVENSGVPSFDVPAAFRPTFLHDQLPIDLLGKLSVGYMLAPLGVTPLDADGRDPGARARLRLVYQGIDGQIFENTAALPRAFFAKAVIKVPDEASALQMLTRTDYDPINAAIVIEGGPTFDSEELPSFPEQDQLLASATITGETLNTVEVTCSTSAPALLVLNDSWSPGWTVMVDGATRPVTRVNYAFRGVVVPSGEHRVVFRYKPSLLHIGMVISALGLLLTVGFLGWQIRPANGQWRERPTSFHSPIS